MLHRVRCSTRSEDIPRRRVLGKTCRVLQKKNPKNIGVPRNKVFRGCRYSSEPGKYPADRCSPESVRSRSRCSTEVCVKGGSRTRTEAVPRSQRCSVKAPSSEAGVGGRASSSFSSTYPPVAFYRLLLNQGGGTGKRGGRVAGESRVSRCVRRRRRTASTHSHTSSPAVEPQSAGTCREVMSVTLASRGDP